MNWIIVLKQIDSRILELMASRLCHEFVGPVGAVSNGVELVEETDGSIAEEAMEMVGASARELAVRVKFYRIAYGMAGAASNNLAELRGLSTALFGEGAVKLNWPMPPIAPRLADGEGKIILNMIAIAKGALSRGGEVGVNLEGNDLIVTACGEGASIADDLVQAMATDISIDDLTPRNVHGFWTSLLAARVQRKVIFEVVNDSEVKLQV